MLISVPSGSYLKKHFELPATWIWLLQSSCLLLASQLEFTNSGLAAFFFQPKKRRHLNLWGTCFVSRLPYKILQEEYNIGICPHSHSQWAVTLTKAFHNHRMYLYHFKGGFWVCEQDWTRPFKKNAPHLSLDLALPLSLCFKLILHMLSYASCFRIVLLSYTCTFHNHVDCVWVAIAQNESKWDASHQQWVKPFFISAQFASSSTSTFCNWLFSLRNLSNCDRFQSGEIHRNNLKCKACERRGIGKCVNYMYMTVFDSIHVTGIYS